MDNRFYSIGEIKAEIQDCDRIINRNRIEIKLAKDNIKFYEDYKKIWIKKLNKEQINETSN